MTGADRFRFLNGQTTNDVRKASPDATQESCVLNSKGHLDAHIFLFAVPNEIWIDTEAELREQLQGRLERYIIADDVLVEDASEGFALFHVLAESRPEGAGARFCVRSRRLGYDGWDYGSNQAQRRKRQMHSHTTQQMKTNETLRSGMESALGRELTPILFPGRTW